MENDRTTIGQTPQPVKSNKFQTVLNTFEQESCSTELDFRVQLPFEHMKSMDQSSMPKLPDLDDEGEAVPLMPTLDSSRQGTIYASRILGCQIVNLETSVEDEELRLDTLQHSDSMPIRVSMLTNLNDVGALDSDNDEVRF